MELKDLSETQRSTVEAAIHAMQAGLRVNLTYHGEGRTVEVHAVGLSKKDSKPTMRVWQVTGGAVFGQGSGWKLFKMEDVESVHILDVKSEGPRPGYAPGDRGMGTILAEISSEPVPTDQ